jgi:L-alanine-DL-glutamate epimerase-like enolase superfamily enzyme
MAGMQVRMARAEDLGPVLEMMGDYNRLEQIEWSKERCAAPLGELLGDHSLGMVVVAEQDGAAAGYAVLTFGYDLEFGGRDAFLTEFYLMPAVRGRGLSRVLLSEVERCAIASEVRAALGDNGDWVVDFHQRFDFADAVRACRLIEEYEPYFVEDPVADAQALTEIPKLRQLTAVPLTHGEEWGQRWDFHKLVENKDIDYIRATLPNVGGITEMKKIAALCETHAVGICPHFTGPIATAALVHCLASFSGPVLVEIGSNTRLPNHIHEGLDFRDGKCWPTQRPGLGVSINMDQLTLLGETTEKGKRLFYRRPDGSLTHW